MQCQNTKEKFLRELEKVGGGVGYMEKKLGGWAVSPPIIPALSEAEEGGSLEPRSLTSAWAMQQDLDSTKKLKISLAW